MIDVGRLCRRVPRMGALGSCLRFGAQPRTTPPHAPARLQSAYLLHQLPPSLLRPTAVWHPGGSGRSRPTRSNGGRGCLWSLWWGGLALCGGGERSLVGEDLAVAGLGKGRGTEHGERGGGGRGRPVGVSAGGSLCLITRCCRPTAVAPRLAPWNVAHEPAAAAFGRRRGGCLPRRWLVQAARRG